METEWYYQRHERETGVKKNYCTDGTAEVEDDTKEEAALRASWRTRRRILVERHRALIRLEDLQERIQMVEATKAKMGEHVGEK
ncbi:hypothetical protein M0R45_029523 [Rubus argutus]|uniref:Uncharacterized protein n=1 Tax=Rubus argutus TaxID=59490 RepID=A0AAW1WAX2_RUBAR